MDESQVKAVFLGVLKSDYLPKKDYEKLSGQNRLEKDFGITGDDYWELLEKVNSSLGYKMNLTTYNGFFLPEGLDTIGGVFRLITGRNAKPPTDPTIDELVKIIFADIQGR